MRVLHVVNGADVGGAERLLCSLAQEQRRTGLEPHLLVLLPRGPLSPRYTEAFCTVEHLAVPKAARALPQAIWGLRKRVKTLQPDVVHSHLSQADLVNFLTPHRRTKVSTLHSSVLIGRGLRSRAVNRVLSHSLTHFDLVIACGAGPAAFLTEQHPTVRMERIDNGIDLPPWEPPSTRERTFVVLAAYRPEKRQDRAIRAFRQSGLAEKGWRLRLVGPGIDESPTLKDLAAELGPVVALEGPVEDPDGLLRSTAALVISSDVEGLPMVGLEALAQGTPVIATDVGSNAQLTPDSRFLVARDETALAGAMRQLAALSDEEFRALERTCRTLAESRFSMTVHSRRVAEAYSSAAAP